MEMTAASETTVAVDQHATHAQVMTAVSVMTVAQATTVALDQTAVTEADAQLVQALRLK